MRLLPLILLLALPAFADVQSDCEAEARSQMEAEEIPEEYREILAEQREATFRARVEFCIAARTMTPEEFREFLKEAFPQ